MAKTIKEVDTQVVKVETTNPGAIVNTDTLVVTEVSNSNDKGVLPIPKPKSETEVTSNGITFVIGEY